MSTTAQGLCDLQEAVAEAHAISNRRGSPRIRQECHAEMSPWANGRAGMAFGVVVENFSTTGVGIRHTDRLREGAQYLLEVPRPGSTPLATLLTVVRCDENAGGWFESEMAPGDVLEVAAELAHRRARRASRLRRFRALAMPSSAALAAVVATFLL